MKLLFASLLLIAINTHTVSADEQIIVRSINAAVSQNIIAAGLLTIVDETDHNVKIVCDQNAKTCNLYGRNLEGGNKGISSVMGGPAENLIDALVKTPGITKGGTEIMAIFTFGNVTCSDDGYGVECDVSQE